MKREPSVRILLNVSPYFQSVKFDSETFTFLTSLLGENVNVSAYFRSNPSSQLNSLRALHLRWSLLMTWKVFWLIFFSISVASQELVKENKKVNKVMEKRLLEAVTLSTRRLCPWTGIWVPPPPPPPPFEIWGKFNHQTIPILFFLNLKYTTIKFQFKNSS